MYRDGLAYYMYIFATSILVIALFKALPGQLVIYLGGLSVFHRNVHAILSARLVINLRKVADRIEQQQTGQELTTLDWANPMASGDMELRDRISPVP